MLFANYVLRSDNNENPISWTDIRDNKEGAFSILKNDIYSLVNKKNEQVKSLEKKRDILSEYMADISHQLKTPITSMMIIKGVWTNWNSKDFCRNIIRYK